MSTDLTPRASAELATGPPLRPDSRLARRSPSLRRGTRAALPDRRPVPRHRQRMDRPAEDREHSADIHPAVLGVGAVRPGVRCSPARCPLRAGGGLRPVSGDRADAASGQGRRPRGEGSGGAAAFGRCAGERAVGLFLVPHVRGARGEGVRPGGVDADPFALVSRPEIDPDHSDTEVLTEEETAQLLVAARTDSPRAYALLAWMYFMAMRVDSALGAQVEDLGYDAGHRTLSVRLKGGRRRPPQRSTGTWPGGPRGRCSPPVPAGRWTSRTCGS